MKLTERLEIFRPILVRLMARDGIYGGPMDNFDIARNAGMLEPAVEAISRSIAWDGIEVYQMIHFCRACGIDMDNTVSLRRACDYLRKNPSFSHIRKTGAWETYYKPLMIKWRKSYGIVKPDADIWPPLRRLLIRLNPLLKQ